ncbi:hypothetical protein SEVIR_8G034800v4 [Setaria viridis]|uniref:FAF domain-containing protein n=3 Tax=Setaria TaxID=4554 RepID=K3ZJI9_SETIT|nr:protein FANTASTIC FOUR 3 isoform X2 [Setaria italica]XP_004978707.1 protein FANTASTIC FOUR 3 isoform X2 [Setaria italica]XP_034568821.1 protein FANTASTIC FOUR 3-like [Setaria viridis]XP_034568822.1 protein FANTASTIC FOUR 3-like [Setaria viridis]RCV37090.1 hypothetical protein SETIT_8G035100v2 [Setaria italica]RCV37091.1 hypothetical protein SETIT_8G035100v2 [Setaria italica]TKV99315.1 hypothetical protein SEVIR_8G034800v2 [Setaria viridis]TKV99316.1 hypothetical protein SEVIR_8G034800v2 [
MFSRDKQLMPAPMASDGGLRRLFEKPLPENPTLLEALSACHRNTHPNPNRPIDPSSFTEIFGELHFQEKQQPERAALPPAPAPASWLDIATAAEADEKSKDDSSLDALLRPKPAASAVATVKRSASFCLNKSSASLLLCTEGLGSESTVDADDMVKFDGDAEAEADAVKGTETTADGSRNVDAAGAAEEAMKEERQPKAFPPPIRSIGRGGKPYVCFRSFREDGRFVLLEVVIPGKELLQATREGGRLRLQFANAAAAAKMHGEDDDHHAAKNACID